MFKSFALGVRKNRMRVLVLPHSISVTLGLWAWVFQSVIWAWLSIPLIVAFWKPQWYNARKMISTVTREHSKMQYTGPIHCIHALLIILLWIKQNGLLHLEWHQIIQHFDILKPQMWTYNSKELSTRKLSKNLDFFAHLYYDVYHDLSLTSVGLFGPIQNSVLEFILWHSESPIKFHVSHPTLPAGFPELVSETY